MDPRPGTPERARGSPHAAKGRGAAARGGEGAKGGGAGKRTKAKAYSTRYSQAVSHPSTNQARPCLASEIRRDRARSGWYGRRRRRPRPGALRGRAAPAWQAPGSPAPAAPWSADGPPPGDPVPRSLPPGPQRAWAASTDWRRAPGPGAGCPAWRGRAGPPPLGEPGAGRRTRTRTRTRTAECAGGAGRARPGGAGFRDCGVVGSC